MAPWLSRTYLERDKLRRSVLAMDDDDFEDLYGDVGTVSHSWKAAGGDSVAAVSREDVDLNIGSLTSRDSASGRG